MVNGRQVDSLFAVFYFLYICVINSKRFYYELS